MMMMMIPRIRQVHHVSPQTEGLVWSEKHRERRKQIEGCVGKKEGEQGTLSSTVSSREAY